MTWKVTFTQNTAVKGLGTLSAAYDDGAGLTCSHVQPRIDSASDFGSFIDACRATLAAAQAERTELAAIAAKVEVVLNAP